MSWLESIITTLWGNALVAAGLAIVAYAVSKTRAPKSAVHALWVLVLLKLVTPAWFTTKIELPIAELIAAASAPESGEGEALSTGRFVDGTGTANPRGIEGLGDTEFAPRARLSPSDLDEILRRVHEDQARNPGYGARVFDRDAAVVREDEDVFLPLGGASLESFAESPNGDDLSDEPIDGADSSTDSPRWILEEGVPQLSAIEDDAVGSSLPVPPGAAGLRPSREEAGVLAEARVASAAVTLKQWFHWGILIQVVGTLLVLVWTLGKLLMFGRVLRRVRPATAELRDRTAELAGILGLSRTPEIAIVDARISPLVWSLFSRPRILVPAALLRRLDGDALDTLLVHELAHIKRGDHWTRHLELAVRAIHWWNPVVWWAVLKLRITEEECCDSWVVWALPHGRRRYADALIGTVEFLNESPFALPAAASGMGQVDDLKRRLTMIMQGKVRRVLPLSTRIAMLALASVTLSWMPAFGQDAPPRPQPPKPERFGEPRPSAPLPSAPKTVDEPAFPGTVAAPRRFPGVARGRVRRVAPSSSEALQLQLERAAEMADHHRVEVDNLSSVLENLEASLSQARSKSDRTAVRRIQGELEDAEAALLEAQSVLETVGDAEHFEFPAEAFGRVTFGGANHGGGSGGQDRFQLSAEPGLRESLQAGIKALHDANQPEHAEALRRHLARLSESRGGGVIARVLEGEQAQHVLRARLDSNRALEEMHDALRESRAKHERALEAARADRSRIEVQREQLRARASAMRSNMEAMRGAQEQERHRVKGLEEALVEARAGADLATIEVAEIQGRAVETARKIEPLQAQIRLIEKRHAEEVVRVERKLDELSELVRRLVGDRAESDSAGRAEAPRRSGGSRGGSGRAGRGRRQ